MNYGKGRQEEEVPAFSARISNVIRAHDKQNPRRVNMTNRGILGTMEKEELCICIHTAH